MGNWHILSHMGMSVGAPRPRPTPSPSPCQIGQLACVVREELGTPEALWPRAVPPSKRPALPDSLVGGVVHKSSQGRADAQRLVATRLLDRLHDPLGHFSRMQRIHPRAR